MISLGIVLIFGGYSVASYGYVLVRGWDITATQWWSPVHPWTWQGDPKTVPPGQIMPGATPAGGSQPAPPSSAPPPLVPTAPYVLPKPGASAGDRLKAAIENTFRQIFGGGFL